MFCNLLSLEHCCTGTILSLNNEKIAPESDASYFILNLHAPHWGLAKCISFYVQNESKYHGKVPFILWFTTLSFSLWRKNLWNILWCPRNRCTPNHFTSIIDITFSFPQCDGRGWKLFHRQCSFIDQHNQGGFQSSLKGCCPIYFEQMPALLQVSDFYVHWKQLKILAMQNRLSSSPTSYIRNHQILKPLQLEWKIFWISVAELYGSLQFNEWFFLLQNFGALGRIIHIRTLETASRF